MTCVITFTFACHIYSKMSLSTFKSSSIWQTEDEKTIAIHFRLIPTLISFIRKINQIHLLGLTGMFHLGFFSKKKCQTRECERPKKGKGGGQK